jgi:hypothetical protein
MGYIEDRTSYFLCGLRCDDGAGRPPWSAISKVTLLCTGKLSG